jgi:hypothetical protein
LRSKEHQGAGLANSAADGERKFVVDDCLVIGELDELPSRFDIVKLATQGFGVYANAHGGEFVAAFGDGIPDQNVAIEAVGIFVGF